MRTWLAAILLLLLAVPYHPYWQSFEQARRGLLLILVPVLVLWPRVLPKDMPRAVLPFLTLVAWLLIRSVGVTNPGLAFERSLMWLSLVALMIVGSGMAPRDVAIAALPTGIVVAAWALCQNMAGLRPVSTLGNINVASEVLTMAGATAALLPVLGERRKSLLVAALATVFLSGAAVVANTSLSGLIALPLAALPVAFHKQVSGRTRFATLAVLCAGMLLGTGLRPEEKPAKPTTDAGVPASTTDVRIHLWNGTARMGVDRFLVGHGTGQFPVEYPRYRRPQEIEATTLGRHQSTGGESPHQDYLELFAEGGVIAFLLLAAGIVQVLRQAQFWAWGPLLGFGFLAGVRSPLGNAPAAVLLFLWMGTVLHGVHEPEHRVGLGGRWRPWLLALSAAAMLVAGFSVFLGQCAFTGYLRQAALHSQGKPSSQAEAMTALDRALFWNPYQQKFLQLRARHSLPYLERWHVGKGPANADEESRLQSAHVATSSLLALYPWDEEGLIVQGWVRRAEGKPEEAREVLTRLLEIDPQNPRAAAAKARFLVEAGDAAEALGTLYANPHPSLRKAFVEILSNLHAVAQQLNHTEDAELLFRERLFLDALDTLTKTPGLQAQMTVNSYLEACGKHARATGDMRPLLVQALFLLGLGRPKDAAALAESAKDRVLRKDQRRLMGKELDRLKELDPWRALLWEPK